MSLNEGLSVRSCDQHSPASSTLSESIVFGISVLASAKTIHQNCACDDAGEALRLRAISARIKADEKMSTLSAPCCASLERKANCEFRNTSNLGACSAPSLGS
jgi:hypothetical protein